MNEPKARSIRPRIVLRNVAICLGLSLFGRVAIRIALSVTSFTNASVLAIAAFNLFLEILGFFICGYLTRQRRWTYLALTAIAVWLSGLANVALARISIFTWVFGLPATLVIMLVGGGFSTLVASDHEQDDSTA